MKARGRRGEGAKGRHSGSPSRPLALSPSRPLVLGLGQRARGDDAAGLLVAERLAALAPPGVIAHEYHGDGAGLIDAWDGALSVILVDAVVSGAAPGTIHRFDAARAPLPAAVEHRSSHAFGLGGAVELARLLGRLPESLLVIGIEAGDFTLGASPSRDVLAAVEAVVAELAARFFTVCE